MSTIKLGPSFFQHELRVYRDAFLAFWRELFQNSIDANAKHINISMTDLDSNTVRVVFEDDGIGMDRHTLENVYFVLGETTKQGANTVGGFGKARILNCFAQKHYKLHTGNLLVTGCGAEYEISTIPEYYKGVKLIVDVNTFTFGYNTNLREKLALYLKFSYISANVFVDGKKWTEWTYKRNYCRSLSFGDVYTNDSRDPNVIVRVNGTLMFVRFSGAPTQVLVEITPEMSRRVLQANRDGLTGDYFEELDAFIAALNVNKQSTLHPQKKKNSNYRGNGIFSLWRTEDPKTKKIINEQELLPVAKPRRYAVANFTNGEAISLPSVAMLEFETEERKPELNIFSVFTLDHGVTSPKVRAAIDRFNPVNWDFQGEERYIRGELKNIRKGVECYKLLCIWKVACEEALRIMINEFPFTPAGLDWGTGWVFSSNADAVHHEEDGVHYFLLNPVTEDGLMRYSTTQKEDLVTLLTFAIHEVTHWLYSAHDELYANVMTRLTAKVFLHQSEILNKMKAAKEGI